MSSTTPTNFNNYCDDSDGNISSGDVDDIGEGIGILTIYERLQGVIQRVHGRCIVLLENMRETMMFSTASRRKKGEIKGFLHCTMAELIVMEAKSSLKRILLQEGVIAQAGEMDFSLFCK